MSGFANRITWEVDFEADGRQVARLSLHHSDNEHAYGVVPIPIAVLKNGTVDAPTPRDAQDDSQRALRIDAVTNDMLESGTGSDRESYPGIPAPIDSGTSNWGRTIAFAAAAALIGLALSQLL